MNSKMKNAVLCGLLLSTPAAYASLCEPCLTTWFCETDAGGSNYAWTAHTGSVTQSAVPYMAVYHCPSQTNGDVEVDWDVGQVHYSDRKQSGCGAGP